MKNTIRAFWKAFWQILVISKQAKTAMQVHPVRIISKPSKNLPGSPLHPPLMAWIGISIFVLPACHKDPVAEETTCYSPTMKTLSGKHLGDVGSAHDLKMVFDQENQLVMVHGDRIVYMDKQSDGVTSELPFKGIQGIAANEQDTILHTNFQFFRFHPSTRSIAPLYDNGINDIDIFSIVPGQGLAYITRLKSDLVLSYYDFVAKSNRVVLNLTESVPQLEFPFGQMHGYLKDGRPHVLLAFNEYNSTIRSSGHVLDIDLEKDDIERWNSLKEISQMEVVDFNDGRTIYLTGYPATEMVKRAVYSLDMVSGVKQLLLPLSTDRDVLTDFKKGLFLTEVTKDPQKPYKARLWNYRTGEERISFLAPKTYYESNPITDHIGDDTLIYASYYSAFVVGTDNCITHTLTDNHRFQRLLSSTPSHVIALMDNGSVMMFPIE